MKDEDLLQCPLLQGLDAMHRAELLGLLNDSNVREKVETCMARLPRHADSGLGKEPSQKHDFEKDVHTWNPELPMWRRSAKE